MATVVLGGFLTGQWIVGGLDLGKAHPGYFLPRVAGGLVASGSLAEVQLRDAAEATFGIGILCWLQRRGRLDAAGGVPGGTALAVILLVLITGFVGFVGIIAVRTVRLARRGQLFPTPAAPPAAATAAAGPAAPASGGSR